MEVNLYSECVDPWDEDFPHLKQQEFLSIDRKGKKTTRAHAVGGRGSGKTRVLFLRLLDCVQKNPGRASMWTEPTFRHCKDIFLRDLPHVVPKELYTINHGDMTVTWWNKHITYIRSRNVDNPSKESTKGLTLCAAFEDEIAYKFDPVKYWDVDACIRDPLAVEPSHDCSTTPKLNTYYTLVHSEGHKVVSMTSYDNPHLNEEQIRDLERQMSKRRAQQEIHGEWVPQGFYMWPDWSDDDWPAGNMIDYYHDFSRPWYLAFDIGSATGAYLAIQAIQPPDVTHNPEPLWIVTHEWLPRRDGSVDRVFPQIKQALGRPMRIAVGADVNTRTATTGDTPMFFITRHFGAVPTTVVSGFLADKEMQLAQLSYGICNAVGRRRFLVSKHLKTYPPLEDEKHSRGILDAMHKDHWPDENDQRAPKRIWESVKGAQFPTEHVRDAAMYGSVAYMFPPQFGMRQDYAA